MQTSPILTHRRFGIDEQVWIVMLTVIVLCAGLMGYSLIRTKPCVPFIISAKGINSDGKMYYTGDAIRFTSSVTGKNITWFFGDQTPVVKGYSLVSHSYLKEGKYIVTANINGACSQSVSVYIRKPGAFRNSVPDTENPGTVITGNSNAEVNKGEFYMCNVPATNFEWSILNRNEYKKKFGKMALYTFKVPGTYTLQLKLDNDRTKAYTKQIYVAPAAKQPVPGMPKPMKPVIVAPGPRPDDQAGRTEAEKKDALLPEVTKAEETTNIEIGNKTFLIWMQGVVSGSKTIQDFSRFLCDGANTHVLINNDSRQRSFGEVCSMISNNEKRRVEDVQLFKENKCITHLKVTIKKKNILGRWVLL